MKVARPGGLDNADEDAHRLVLEYLRATPRVLTAIATLVFALTGLVTILLKFTALLK